ncbi:MAG: carboxymuconolactone decarboxylase family protein, partial [Myxococcota bacterium]
TARCGCEYEWGVHVSFFAERVGLGAAEVAATVQGGAEHPAWSEAERTLIRLADELHEQARISDPRWAELRQHWRDDQLVELVVLAGFYHTISFVVNGLGVEREPRAPGFPAARSDQRR